MTAENSTPQESRPNSILSYVKDLPNICSLAGLACTTLAIYYSILGIYSVAMIGMIWAVAFDWADGLIARRMKGRTGEDRIFGGQLDVLIDIVSYGVTPAILLLSYGKFDAIFLPGAFLMIAASAMRLSYFSTFGLAGGSKYTGLALDNETNKDKSRDSRDFIILLNKPGQTTGDLLIANIFFGCQITTVLNKETLYARRAEEALARHRRSKKPYVVITVNTLLC